MTAVCVSVSRLITAVDGWSAQCMMGCVVRMMRGWWRLYSQALRIIRSSGGSGNSAGNFFKIKKCININCGWVAIGCIGTWQWTSKKALSGLCRMERYETPNNNEWSARVAYSFSYMSHQRKICHCSERNKTAYFHDCSILRGESCSFPQAVRANAHSVQLTAF